MFKVILKSEISTIMQCITHVLLWVLIAGILCPSQITFTHADERPELIALNVCKVHPPFLSVDSNSPVNVTSFTTAVVFLQSEFICEDSGTPYKFFFIYKILKPPKA